MNLLFSHMYTRYLVCDTPMSERPEGAKSRIRRDCKGIPTSTKVACLLPYWSQEEEQGRQAFCWGEAQTIHVREKKKVPNSHLLPTLPPLRIVPKLRKSNIIWNEMRLPTVEEMLVEPSSRGQKPLSHFPSRLSHVPESVLPGRGSLTRDRSIY